MSKILRVTGSVEHVYYVRVADDWEDDGSYYSDVNCAVDQMMRDNLAVESKGIDFDIEEISEEPKYGIDIDLTEEEAE